ncbi:MAG: GNAT family N-acetyltransferase [Bacillota bacterium]|nr:GNAT family N-acetyltransferase [Bacillota bacterium]
MESFTVPIHHVQPTQLYISEVKLKKVRTYLENADFNSLDPLPVKKIGDTVFFTDGHTRALALLELGFGDIRVYWDQDELDWLQYLICLAWCDEAKIREIAHLKDRVVDHSTYRRLWHKRCDAMQKEVKEGNYPAVCTKQIASPEEKSAIAESILRALPEWFGIEKALQDYVRGVAQTHFFAVQVGNRPVGFASIVHHNEFTSEIYCMGIYQEVHNRGLGKLLLESVEGFLRGEGKKFLTVKTLGDSWPSAEYGRTKRFYRSVGFFPLEESTEIWDGTPCLIMVKPL